MMKTSDLIFRLSSEGPSRELDAEIALANGWTKIQFGNIPEPAWRSPTGQICPQPPRYTESIDAALTLMPSWANSHGYDFGPREVGAYVSLNNVGSGHRLVEGWHRTFPAIALVIACLKAKEEDSKP